VPSPDYLAEFLISGLELLAENRRFEAAMNEKRADLCGKCGAEVDPTRKMGFTLNEAI
jgi:hypothetical protein